jgi:hypothetical protein
MVLVRAKDILVPGMIRARITGSSDHDLRAEKLPGSA